MSPQILIPCLISPPFDCQKYFMLAQTGQKLRTDFLRKVSENGERSSTCGPFPQKNSRVAFEAIPPWQQASKMIIL